MMRMLPISTSLVLLSAVLIASNVYSGGKMESALGLASPAAHVAVSTQAAHPSADQPAAQTTTPISEEAAQNAVWALPEVQRQAEYVRAHGARPFTMTSSAPEPGARPGTPGAAYIIYFGEDLGDHVAQIGTYSVDAFTGQVLLHDPSMVAEP